MGYPYMAYTPYMGYPYMAYTPYMGYPYMRALPIHGRLGLEVKLFLLAVRAGAERFLVAASRRKFI